MRDFPVLTQDCQGSNLASNIYVRLKDEAAVETNGKVASSGRNFMATELLAQILFKVRMGRRNRGGVDCRIATNWIEP